MFIMSAKMDKKKLLTILACVAVALVAVILAVSLSRGGSGDSVRTGSTPKDVQRFLKRSKLKSNEDRLALLTALGWEVNIQPLEALEVQIPEEFSAVYEEYNALQKAQGLDLSALKGKKVMRYTYEIVNYPDEENVNATLLVYKDKLVGGDICSARLGGFMHTLSGDAELRKFGPADEKDAAGPVVTEEYRPVNYDDPDIYPTE